MQVTIQLTKREQAHDILRALFQGRSRIAIAEAVDAAGRLEVSKRTVQRAARDLGLFEVHNGPYGAFWEQAGSPSGR
jgi:hypothetical protein